jgi:hypothetical protein
VSSRRDDADELGPLPRLHPRSDIQRQAEHEIATAVAEAFARHELTFGEQLRVLASVFGGRVESLGRAACTHERHGKNPKGKRSDET